MNTPVLRPHSGNHSSGIRHSIFNFVPPHTKSRHSREIRAISRYSTCYPQGHFPPAYLPAARRPTLPRLRVHGCLSLLLLPCARSRLSENLLPTATRPCVISTLLLAEQNERRAPILQPPHRSPTACPFLPSLPIFLIHAHHHGLSSMESNVSPVSSVYRSPGHAPFFSILRAFQSFTVFSPCCFPPPGLFG